MPTPRYKIRPDTGDLQEYLFEYNGILALKNFVARVDGERLILHSAADMNFSILDALVSEVEIDGRVYDNAEAAQEALMRLTFNTNRPVLMTQQERELLQGALQKGTYVGTAADLKALIDGKVDKEAGKGLSTNDFTNAYKQKLDTLEDYDIELDEATTEFKFKKGNNVIKRISLMFLDDEGTKLLYNRTAKTLELRDKRDNLLTSIPVSHFVSNIPTSIVVQNGKIKLMAGSEVINENTISYNDLANKPNLDFAPRSHTHSWNDITGKPSLNFAPLHHRHNWSEIEGKPSLNFAPLNHTHSWNDIEGKPSLDFIPTSWNKRNNKEVIRTQVDEWLRINELNSHTNGVYFGTSTVRTDGQVQVGEGGAEAILSNLGLLLKKRLRINAWAGGDGADIKCKGRMQIASSSGIIDFRKIFDDLVNWNGNATVTIDINDGKITSKILDTNRIIFGSENNIISAWTGGFDLATRQSLLNIGALNTIKFRKIDDTGWKNDLIEMNVNDGTLRVNGIKSNANVSGEYLFTTNGSTLHLPSFIGTCGQISGVWSITTSWYGRQINIVGVSTVNLSSMSQNQSIAFRKCFAGGAVTFNTTGKQVVYTGDNTFNGGDGSTAVVSTAGGNKMYIDIRNV